MADVAQNLAKILEEIPKDVTLVAVSKTKPVSDIQAALNIGHLHFGENKVQELTGKQEELADRKDLKWHMIGHLQRNKVKYLVDFVHLIHSVDSPRLLKEINKRSRNAGVVTNCLLQVHIAEEESKYGFDEQELNELVNSEAFQGYEHVNIKGLMGMATFTEDHQKVAREFKSLRSLFENLEVKGNKLEILSMGMSNDYKIALDEGSNMLRIGSNIFGERN